MSGNDEASAGDSLIPEGAMRVGPGTDAVVFKAWDTTHTECEI